MEQPRTRSSQSCSLSGDGKILTRRTEVDAVDWLELAAVDVPNVVVLRDVRPVLAEDPLTLLVPFNLPTAAPAGGFESEIEATDAGEKTAECECQKGSSPSKVSCLAAPTLATALT